MVLELWWVGWNQETLLLYVFKEKVSWEHKPDLLMNILRKVQYIFTFHLPVNLRKMLSHASFWVLLRFNFPWLVLVSKQQWPVQDQMILLVTSGHDNQLLSCLLKDIYVQVQVLEKSPSNFTCTTSKLGDWREVLINACCLSSQGDTWKQKSENLAVFHTELFCPEDNICTWMLNQQHRIFKGIKNKKKGCFILKLFNFRIQL